MAKELLPAREVCGLLRRLLSLIIGCSVGVGTLCVAAAVTHKQATLKGNFHEIISDNIYLSGFKGTSSVASPASFGIIASAEPVDEKESGTVIMGVSNGSLHGKQINSLAVAAGTERASTEVCLTVLTGDGIYWAHNQYTLPSDIVAGDLVLLPYERSRHLNFLARYADTEIAVMAANGSCDSPVQEVQLVGHMGADNTVIRLYVDSARATDVYASSPQHKRVRCKATTGGRFSYDHICTLKWPVTQQGKLTVNITRERFGSSLPNASVIVVRDTP